MIAHTLYPEPCPACGSEETYLSLNGYDSSLVCRNCSAEQHRRVSCAECFRLDECPEPGEPCSSYIPTP